MEQENTSKSKNAFLSNHFLIAMPALDDENFSQSVTYICEHNADGAMGVTINRPSDILLGDIFEQTQIKPIEPSIASQIVYYGGPVQTDRGFILHDKTEQPWESSLKVTDEISLTTSKDILEAIAIGKGPAHTLITLGYAGWGPGQLEQEMAANAWLSCKADTDIIFNTPIEQRWRAAAKLLGIDLELLSHDAGHA